MICAAVGVPIRIGGITVAGAAAMAFELNSAAQQDNRITDLRIGRLSPRSAVTLAKVKGCANGAKRSVFEGESRCVI